MANRSAIIIGSGFGGLSLGIRLQSLGFDTTILEKLDAPGGRAYVRRAQGFTFDMGPTVITVPHLLEELFSLERGQPHLDGQDFPASIFGAGKRANGGVSGGPNTSRHVTLVPILPFYRIYFEDGTYFDYDGDPAHTREQIAALAPADLAGYERFHADAKAIFEQGFLKLGYTYFKDLPALLTVAPALLRLDAVRSLFSFTSKYFTSDKLRQVFSFEPLLIGGNPLSVPALYAMIHFVETTWGVHFVMGGTGALVRGLLQKFEALGGALRCNSEVKRIVISDEKGGKPARHGRRVARGVELADGNVIEADLVVSNGDYANTYLKLIDPAVRLFNTDNRIHRTRQSMSLLVIYFGFRAAGLALNLRHHNIILSPRYEELLTDIFERKVLPSEMSHYLHVPTLTDPSLAPAGHHAAYALIPVPNRSGTGAAIDWNEAGPRLMDASLRFLDAQGYIPELCDRLVYKSCITPHYFEHDLSSFAGNAFGPEPVLTQSAFFRPHNRSEDIERLYLVGAGTQPGGGVPGVMMGAKITARLIAEDFKLN